MTDLPKNRDEYLAYLKRMDEIYLSNMQALRERRQYAAQERDYNAGVLYVMPEQSQQAQERQGSEQNQKA